MKITKDFLTKFEAEAVKLLANLSTTYGLNVRSAGGRFDADAATLKFEFTPQGAPSKAEKSLSTMGGAFGLPADAVGRTFTLESVLYRVTGLNPRRPKFPVIGERVSDGKAFKFPANDVARAFGGGVTPTGLTVELKKKFVDLCGQLSPENLSCDGELSRSQVDARRAQINRQWRDLETQAGRRVSEAEADGWWAEIGADVRWTTNTGKNVY